MQQKFILQDNAMAKAKPQVPEENKEITPEELTKEWIKFKQSLDQYTQQEKTLRGAVVLAYFKEQLDKLDSTGTFTKDIPELAGELKLVLGQNVKFDQDIFKVCKEKLKEEITENVFDALFKIKFELNEPFFKKLTKDVRLKIIKYNFLEFNRASPSIKFFKKDPV